VALSDQEIVDARRFAGYALDDLAIDARLTNLSTPAEAIVRSTLQQCREMECDLLRSADNLSTAQAAVWQRNKTEIGDREALLYSWRLRLCNLLAVLPGQFIGAIGISMGPGGGVASGAFVA
jgi:hypothetical protein